MNWRAVMLRRPKPINNVPFLTFTVPCALASHQKTSAKNHTCYLASVQFSYSLSQRSFLDFFQRYFLFSANSAPSAVNRSLKNVITSFVKRLGNMVSSSSCLSRQGRGIGREDLDSCFRRNDIKRATRWVAPTIAL